MVQVPEFKIQGAGTAGGRNPTYSAFSLRELALDPFGYLLTISVVDVCFAVTQSMTSSPLHHLLHSTGVFPCTGRLSGKHE